MTQITPFLCILLWSSCQILTSVSGLSCYRCRIDICNHKYCNVTTNNTLVAIGHADGSLPLCPTSESDYSKWNKPEYLHHCQPTEAQVCGHFVFNLTTSYSSIEAKNVSRNANFSVIVQVAHRLRSQVHVFGCVDASQNACPLLPPKSLELGMEAAIERVTVANKGSTCCKCNSDYCNKGRTIDTKQCSLTAQSISLEKEEDDSCLGGSAPSNSSSSGHNEGHSHGQGLIDAGTFLQWRYMNALVVTIILVTM